MSKTILVTGAAGFIGRHVAAAYAMRGMRVVGIGRGDLIDWAQYGLSEWHRVEITLENLTKYAGTPDVIVHCAGGSSVGISMQQPYLDFIQTAQSMAQVLEFMRLYAPQAKLIYPSSAAVYGQTAHLPISENEPLRPISPYGVYKKIAEDLCRLYSEQYNISIAIIRLFSIYGPGLRKQLLWDACLKFSTGERKFFGTGSEIRDWLHVNDVVELIIVAAAHASSKCPVVNGGMGVGITVRDILMQLSACFEQAKKLEFSGKSRAGDPIGYQADISLAQSWGWEPQIDLGKGLNDYAKWFKRIET